VRKTKAITNYNKFSIGFTGLSRIRGKIEDLAEGVVELRRGQTADFDKVVGQMLARGRALPDRSKQSRKSYSTLLFRGVVVSYFGKIPKNLFRLAKIFVVVLLVFSWVFSGIAQIPGTDFPAKPQAAQASSISSVAGTTAGAQDTSYASNDCTDNMGWDGTGSPGNGSSSNDVYIAEDGLLLDDTNVSDELQFSNFGFVIPNGSTIDGVVVEMERFSAVSVTDAHIMITTTAGAQEGNDKSAGATWARKR